MLLLLIFPTFAFAYIAHLSLHKCNIFTSGVHKNAFVKYLAFIIITDLMFLSEIVWHLILNINKTFNQSPGAHYH